MFDELKIYKGSDIYITDKIVVRQATLGEIADFGEKEYFNSVYTLSASGSDFKFQLWDLGIDYTTIDDYDLFLKLTKQALSSQKRIYEMIQNHSNEFDFEINNDELDKLLVNPLQLILKDVDLADFVLCKDNNLDEEILFNVEKDITINRIIFTQIVDAVRKIHNLKRNNEIPANETTKMILIEDAREEYKNNKEKSIQSILKPMISTVVNYKGSNYNHNDIWEVKINAFLDSVKRISKIEDATLLLQGAYSGFGDIKGIDTNRLNMFSN